MRASGYQRPTRHRLRTAGLLVCLAGLFASSGYTLSLAWGLQIGWPVSETPVLMQWVIIGMLGWIVLGLIVMGVMLVFVGFLYVLDIDNGEGTADE